MSSAILDELEELRQSLEKPSEVTTRRLAAPLEHAESHVDDLSHALEQTGRGFESVAESVQAVEAAQASNKAFEIQELRRLLKAKDNSLDSLRETLASTKEASQSKTKKLQQQLDQTQNELRRVEAELQATGKESAELRERLEGSLSSKRRDQKERQGREKELWSALEMAREEQERTERELESEKAEKERLKAKVQKLHSAVDDDGAKDCEIERLRTLLKDEREHFKKAKKWLKAEMKSREEMEELLLSLKKIMDSPKSRKAEWRDDDPRVLSLEDTADFDETRNLLKLRQARLTEDGRSLQSEIQSTRKKLSKALSRRH